MISDIDESWTDRIELKPDVLAGKPVVKGTRIAVEFVIDLLGRGWSQGEILSQYSQLTEADLRACVAYASEILKSERVYPVPG